MDQLRISGSQGIRVEAKFLLSDFKQIAEKDIGTLAEFSHDFDGSGVGQIQEDGFFSPVVHVELKIMISNRIVNLGATAHIAHGITRQGFNLDNPCA